MRWLINPRDKPGLLWAFLRFFEGNATVSFEGNLGELGLAGLPGAGSSESPVLHRHTRWPVQDFVTLAVTPEVSTALQQRLSGPGTFNEGGPVIHVQVESGGSLVLGAYDNFDPECVVACSPTPESLLEDLLASGVIRSYTVAA